MMKTNAELYKQSAIQLSHHIQYTKTGQNERASAKNTRKLRPEVEYNKNAKRLRKRVTPLGDRNLSIY